MLTANGFGEPADPGKSGSGCVFRSEGTCVPTGFGFREPVEPDLSGAVASLIRIASSKAKVLMS